MSVQWATARRRKGTSSRAEFVPKQTDLLGQELSVRHPPHGNPDLEIEAMVLERLVGLGLHDDRSRAVATKSLHRYLFHVSAFGSGTETSATSPSRPT